MDKLKEWQVKIDALSLRERAAVFFCTVFVIYFTWDILLMQPLQITEKQVNSQLQQKQTEQMTLTAQIDSLIAGQRTDPDVVNRQKLVSLKLELEKIEAQVKESTQQLIAPNQMAVVLEAVLLSVRELKLLRVKGLGSEPIIEPVPLKEDGEPAERSVEKMVAADTVDNAYKHGLRIEFEGDYLSTLDYIRELENLEWGFFWDSLEFKVNEYPESTAAITVFTLSLDKNWIGV